MPERFVTTPDGARLWTCATGDPARPTLLLSSGGPGCCDYLEPVAAMVDDLLHVVRWEQRGCGRSTVDGRYDLATTIADLEAIRATYRLDQWIVGGHSWGASLALAYGMDHPHRTRAILYMSAKFIDDRWQAEYRRAKGERPEQQPAQAFPMNLDVNCQLNDDYRRYLEREQPMRRLAAMSWPLIAMHGSADIRPEGAAREVAAAVPAGRCVVVEGAEHCIWLTHADALRETLRESLRDMLCPCAT